MIAVAGPDLPHEVLHAAARHAGALPIAADRPCPSAGRWLESKFAPWAPPLLEHWLEGAYDHLDAVLFSRSDDTSQRLYYYLCELQRLGHLRGPQPLIFDLARIPRAVSLERTVAQVRNLAALLGVDDTALEAAIVATNRQRREAAPLPEGPRCLLLGTAPPDDRLHAVIRTAGLVPMGDTLAQVWSALGDLVAEDSGDPADAIGRALHARQGGPRSFADPSALLAARLAETGPAAVVLWRIEEDEAQCWHLPAERRVLQESGVPHLVLTRRDWLAQDGAGAEIAAFLKELGA